MSLTPQQVLMVQAGLPKIALMSETAGRLFYDRLFTIQPSLRPLFKGDIHDQSRKLMQMIALAVAGLDRAEGLVPALQALGQRHVGYGVKQEDYAPVGDALLWMLERCLGPGFTPEVKAAWTEVYMLVTEVATKAAYPEVPAPQPAVQSVPAPNSPLFRPDNNDLQKRLRGDKKLSCLDLKGFSLKGLDLMLADFSNSDLTEADLSGSNLSLATFDEANLTRANLSKSNLLSARMSRANLSGARLLSADMLSVDLTDANLNGANLTNVILISALLINADLSNARLSSANLTLADMRNAKLEGATLDGVIGMRR